MWSFSCTWNELNSTFINFFNLCGLRLNLAPKVCCMLHLFFFNESLCKKPYSTGSENLKTLIQVYVLTLSWKRSLSYRNHIMELRRERVKELSECTFYHWFQTLNLNFKTGYLFQIFMRGCFTLCLHRVSMNKAVWFVALCVSFTLF